MDTGIYLAELLFGIVAKSYKFVSFPISRGAQI